MAWKEPYYVKKRWDADYVNMIEEDIEYLADIYNATVTQFSVSYSDEVNTIKNTLNTLENNITALVESLPFSVNSYKSNVQYTRTLPKRANLNRWVNILNEIKAR